MRDAAIRELREPEHTTLVTTPVLDKVTPVNNANLF
jgi:hypothetical protein